MSLASISFQIFQKQNHRRIVFTATDHLAQTHRYGPVVTTDVGYDPETVKESIRLKMEDGLAGQEVQDWLDDTEAMAVPVHAVKPRYLSTWRAAYKNAEKEEHRRLGYKMTREDVNNTFTNPQMNTAWNMTNPERIAFLGRVATAHDGWVALQAEVGE